MQTFQNERQISSNILAETIKVFKGLTLDSTINDSAYYHSEEDDAEIDPNRNPKVATHTNGGKKRKVTDTDTTNGNYPRKLLINRLIPVTIPTIDQKISEDTAGIGDTLHARRTILSKEIVTNAARRSARVLWTLADVIWHGTDGTTPRDGNTFIGSTRLAYPVLLGESVVLPPIRTG